ncbi:MAG TPA: arginine deiminase family protein, partial [Chloroflexia bacterium]|nr:arginine deiminase family protein [Chloroflexia bacterium]
ALEAAPPEVLDAVLARTARIQAEPAPAEQRTAQLEEEVAVLEAELALLRGATPPPAHAAPRARIASALSDRRRGYLEAHLQHLAGDRAFAALAATLIEGIETNNPGLPGEFVTPELAQLDSLEDEDRILRFVEGRLFHLTPLPNLMFSRDGAAVVGDRIVLSRMAAFARRRETLLLDFVTGAHPRFAGVERWPAGPDTAHGTERPYWEEPELQHVPDERTGLYPAHAAYLEGGNILQLRPDLIAVGVSPRTTMPAVQRLVRAWEAAAVAAGRRQVLYVLRLPTGHNHLDSVFSLLSATECVLYRPVFMPYGPASVDVIRVELGDGGAQPERRSSFLHSLRDDGLDLQAIFCGGADPIDQEREEWFSGANLLTLAPGKVVTYRSTDRTVAELVKAGYEVIDSNDVLQAGRAIKLEGSDKWVLRIRGSELARGHGGPHSLVLPLVREN